MSRISCRGASGAPLAVAGQTAVQRPHSVQENASSTCFQFRSASDGDAEQALGRRVERGHRGGRHLA